MRPAIAVFLVVGVFLTAPVSAAAHGPALQVLNSAPLTIRGVRFVPLERVTVVAQVDGRHVRVVVASKEGTFTVRFSTVLLGYCQAYIVRATGSRGSRAYLRSLTECNPPSPAP